MATHRPTKVLLFPWIAKGHVTPYLELAKKLAKRNFQVYLCSSPIILESISKVLAKHHPHITPSIHLLELHLPSSPELPPHHHTTTALPPHLITTLQTAFQETKRVFYDIISTLNPELLIYDGFQPWAASHASSLNIPSVHLITTGAVTMSHFLHLFHVDEIKCDEFRFSPIHSHDDHEMKKFVEICSSADEEDVIDIGVLCFRSLHLSKSFILINTCSEIEDKYIKYLSLLSKKEVLPIGPLIRETRDDDEYKEITEWLQKKEESSCVLASFGSEYYMSNKEIEEIARGLELSGLNFIWSLKFPIGVNTSVEEAMPRGYLETVKHKGLVVKGWVPQAKILSDKRICGFLSHCGWNSVLESLAFGVPIIALPIHLDQPINARLIEEIGVGVEVVKGENGEIKGEELAKALKKVVKMEKKSGGEALETSMNYKAKELSERMKLSGDKVIDCAVDKLLQLCKERN